MNSQLKFLVLLLLTISEMARAQAPSIQFSKIFGGSGEDIGSYLIQTSDKGFLIFGSTNSTDGQVFGVIDSLINQYDLWVVKTDSTGDLVWAQTVLGRASTPWCVTELSDAYVIGGYTYGTTHDFSGFPGGTSPNNYVAWLDKVDGHVLLARQYSNGTPGMSTTYAMNRFDDSNFIAVGTISANCWVAKLDNVSGDTLWQRSFGGSLNDAGYSITVSDSALYIAGVTSSTNGDIIDNIGGSQAWVLKTDLSGEILWSRTYWGDQYGWFISIDEDPSGNLFCGGKAYGGGTHRSGYHGMKDYWVVKLNSDGDTLWGKCYGGSGDDDFHNLVATNDGGAIIFGRSLSGDGDISAPPMITDFWMLRIDSNGTIIWDTTLGSNLNDNAGVITPTCDNGYAFTAMVPQVSKDVTGTAFGSFEVWLCKLSPDGLDNHDCPVVTHTQSLTLPKDEVTVYPNPASLQVQVAGMVSGGAFSINITDVSGRIIYSATQLQQNHNIDVSTFASGVYFIVASNDDVSLTRKLIIY